MLLLVFIYYYYCYYYYYFIYLSSTILYYAKDDRFEFRSVDPQMRKTVRQTPDENSPKIHRTSFEPATSATFQRI